MYTAIIFIIFSLTVSEAFHYGKSSSKDVATSTRASKVQQNRLKHQLHRMFDLSPPIPIPELNKSFTEVCTEKCNPFMAEHGMIHLCDTAICPFMSQCKDQLLMGTTVSSESSAIEQCKMKTSRKLKKHQRFMETCPGKCKQFANQPGKNGFPESFCNEIVCPFMVHCTVWTGNPMGECKTSVKSVLQAMKSSEIAYTQGENVSPNEFTTEKIDEVSSIGSGSVSDPLLSDQYDYNTPMPMDNPNHMDTEDQAALSEGLTAGDLSDPEEVYQAKAFYDANSDDETEVRDYHRSFDSQSDNHTEIRVPGLP